MKHNQTTNLQHRIIRRRDYESRHPEEGEVMNTNHNPRRPFRTFTFLAIGLFAAACLFAPTQIARAEDGGQAVADSALTRVPAPAAEAATPLEPLAEQQISPTTTGKPAAEPPAPTIDLASVHSQPIVAATTPESEGESVNAVGAPDPTLDETVYEAIDPPWDVDDWSFWAYAGQYVVITMDRTGWGNLDPFIELYNPYGQFRASDDDSGGNLNARLAGTIATTGYYTVRARSYGGGSSGGYALSVNLGSCPPPPPPPCYPRRSYSAQEQIVPAWDIDDWTVYAVAGERLDIWMTQTWGNLDSYIELYDPWGRLVASDDDSGGNRNARLATVLSVSGQWTIRARSYNGNSTGGYALTVIVNG